MKRLESHTVPESVDEIRLSEYIMGKFKAITSRNGLKKAILKGHVKVNGEVGHTADYIRGGEEIVLFQPKTVKAAFLKLFLDVEYEDDHLAIIHKPAGIIVSGNKKRTVENALIFNLKESEAVDKLPRPEPIHRLDHPTSGALLIGKTRSAVTALNKLFEERKVEKVYHAICIGKLDKNGTINTDIKGKKAITDYKLITHKESDKYGGLNLVELKPTTGRRHQLRVHLSEIDCPILGDKVYGDKDKISKGNGLYLHASSLEFDHPFSDEKVSVKIGLPSKFRKLFPSEKSKEEEE